MCWHQSSPDQLTVLGSVISNGTPSLIFCHSVKKVDEESILKSGRAGIGLNSGTSVRRGRMGDEKLQSVRNSNGTGNGGLPFNQGQSIARTREPEVILDQPFSFTFQIQPLAMFSSFFTPKDLLVSFSPIIKFNLLKNDK